MSFSTILFTEKGRALQAKALAGTALNFTKIKMGSGSLSGQSQITLTDLIETQVTLSISELSHSLNYAILKGNFSNNDISTGFYWREIGIFAQDPDLGEILYCYGNAGALAEYIPPQTSEVIEKVVAISVIVGDAVSVSATIDDSLVFATKADISSMNLRMEAVETPVFEDYESGATVPAAETALSNIKKGISILTIFQYIKAFCKGVVTLSRLANNLITTEAGLGLDARQGKVLQDQITAQNDNLAHYKVIKAGIVTLTYSNSTALQAAGLSVTGFSSADDYAVVMTERGNQSKMAKLVLSASKSASMFGIVGIGTGFVSGDTATVEYAVTKTS